MVALPLPHGLVMIDGTRALKSIGDILSSRRRKLSPEASLPWHLNKLQKCHATLSVGVCHCPELYGRRGTGSVSHSLTYDTFFAPGGRAPCSQICVSLLPVEDPDIVTQRVWMWYP